MYYVYVLKSCRNGKRYVGYTGKPPTERLREHNRSPTGWSKRNGPFDLIHMEPFTDKTEARRRELFLKSGVGRQHLDAVLVVPVKGG